MNLQQIQEFSEAFIHDAASNIKPTEKYQYLLTCRKSIVGSNLWPSGVYALNLLYIKESRNVFCVEQISNQNSALQGGDI
jgi:hypothetical protein